MIRYKPGSSDIAWHSKRRRVRALNFADRALFPIW